MEGRSVTIRLDECILWTGYAPPGGYGRISFRGHSQYVHRVIWRLTMGPIPPSQTIDHLCEQKLCINVEHMEVVGRGENARRYFKKREARCKYGHEKVRLPHGWSCRECHRLRSRRSRARLGCTTGG